eukprot:TRINITY_DN11572_c0_g3_i1.p1 TRINITY_DN11572_c0_g3~~TRINITY_DN11572_c0_g3_i1.p1  ORF type:complete len:427 (+),score=65.26 TRINITY_DN11572_c0_g3_i1:1169-2449(+)
MLASCLLYIASISVASSVTASVIVAGPATNVLEFEATSGVLLQNLSSTSDFDGFFIDQQLGLIVWTGNSVRIYNDSQPRVVQLMQPFEDELDFSNGNVYLDSAGALWALASTDGGQGQRNFYLTVSRDGNEPLQPFNSTRIPNTLTFGTLVISEETHQVIACGGHVAAFNATAPGNATWTRNISSKLPVGTTCFASGVSGQMLVVWQYAPMDADNETPHANSSAAPTRSDPTPDTQDFVLVEALDLRTGQPVWQYNATGTIESLGWSVYALQAPSGGLYLTYAPAANATAWVHLSPEGTVVGSSQWPGVFYMYMVLADGAVLRTGQDGHGLTLLSEDGQVRWHLPANGTMWYALAADSSTIYLTRNKCINEQCSSDTSFDLVALDVKNGSIVWAHAFDPDLVDNLDTGAVCVQKRPTPTNSEFVGC